MVAPGPVHPSGPCGIAETPPAELGPVVLACWDDFLDLVHARSTDLTKPSRLKGWTGKDVCVHLGSWPEAPAVTGVLTSARGGAQGPTPDPDAANHALVTAHRDASPEAVVAALLESRNRIADFFASDDAVHLGRALSQSTAGPLPVLGLVNAGTFELAVHAMDLAPCGAPPPSTRLLDRGLSALLDITGALAARQGVDMTLGASTPSGGWAFTSSAEGWTTQPLPPGPLDGVGVRGSAVDLLETAAGRSNLAQLVLTRRLVVQHLPQWMRLAPLLDDVPGLPGGAALKGAVGSLSGVAGGVGKVLGRFRR